MEFPGNSWEHFSLESYNRAQEAAGAPPVPTTQTSSVPPAARVDDLLAPFADLQQGLKEHRGARDSRATLAPRNTLPAIGGSMRLSASSAASLGREHDFHSARHLPYVPESPPA